MSSEAADSTEVPVAADKRAESQPVDDGWGAEPSRRATQVSDDVPDTPANRKVPNAPEDSKLSESDAPAAGVAPERTSPDDGWGEDTGLKERRQAARQARIGDAPATEVPAELQDEMAIDVPHDAEPEVVDAEAVEADENNVDQIAQAREQDAACPDGVAEQQRERRPDVADARRAVDDAIRQQPAESDATVDLPLPADVIAAQTTDNRIALAENAKSGTDAQLEYGGYLDIVMHGNADGMSSNINGHETHFTLDQTAEMIRSSPSWDSRPVRLMSCKTGFGNHAQDLANKLDVPVYAPTGDLFLWPDGTRSIKPDEDGNPGRWRRFEPAP